MTAKNSGVEPTHVQSFRVEWSPAQPPLGRARHRLLCRLRLWNYLNAPLLLARDDITVTEAEPWQESGQQWRRLQATFAPAIDTHCRQQTFYVDNGGLIRRHDFVAEPVGSWAKAALYCDQHREFDGLTFPLDDVCSREAQAAAFPRGRRSWRSTSTTSRSSDEHQLLVTGCRV
ncbi:hypothetical protein ACETU7_18250 [Rhodococcus sp. 3Y1]